MVSIPCKMVVKAELTKIGLHFSNYHRRVVSKAIFNKIDNTIWQLSLKWARRRHPKRNIRETLLAALIGRAIDKATNRLP
jgi:hypothetical protein